MPLLVVTVIASAYAEVRGENVIKNRKDNTVITFTSTNKRAAVYNLLLPFTIFDGDYFRTTGNNCSRLYILDSACVAERDISIQIYEIRF